MGAAAALLWRRLAMSGGVAPPSPPRLASGRSWMGLQKQDELTEANPYEPETEP
jgi:hypothetical protein